MIYVYHKAAFIFELSFPTSTYDARSLWVDFTHVLMNIVERIDLHNSLQITVSFSIRIVWQWKTVKGILVLYTIEGKKKCSVFAKETSKWRPMQYKKKNTISGVYCSSRSFEHIFPAILKTVHSDKNNVKKKLTVSTNHNRAMHYPKLCSALSLIQSNMYFYTKKCIPEILLDIIIYNSYISL